MKRKEKDGIVYEMEKSMLIAQIKHFLGNVEMWQNHIEKWSPYAKENENIAKNLKFARTQVALNLTKIKLCIGRFEQC